ncbi:hypothetical protein N864_07685 [Intrasporangium chromatireducens Q5-1]|uniref:DUF305 domain-containing protein n=1 Tax=Intrasporangium chromatireducens Q5-1 TaxID=584657 RepID=W9GMF1_9MICO|nr:DUF305 domain-containing protein [Intrasporangium chromatireducens]EWT05044.1 hypothetical protein N864_07685 [Intrasporangium chromatireducens Q5-1]
MRPRPVVIVALGVLLALGVVAGLLVGARLGAVPVRQAPPEASVDVGFARAMQAHHDQAVQMATLVRKGTADPEIGSIALDIALTQQHQSGQMYAWLEQWGHPQRSAAPAMSWMKGHDHSSSSGASEQTGATGGRMPGMASRADLAALEAAGGTEAERLFLRLMIEHHEAGVQMAAYAADHAQEPAVRRLARSMTQAQQAEITVLQDLLEVRERRTTPQG